MDIKRSVSSPKSVYNFKRMDHDGLLSDLGICNLLGDPKNFGEVSSNINDAWSFFKSNLLRICKRRIPTVLLKNQNAAPWIDAEVVEASRLKNKAYQKAKETKDVNWLNMFKERRNSIKNLVNRKYKEYLRGISESLSREPKKFWGFFKRLSKTKGGIPDLIKEGKVYDTTKEKAQLLNNVFAKAFSGANVQVPDTVYPRELPELSTIVLGTDEVRNELKTLNPSKAQGPDGLPTRILSEYRNELSDPINMMFNLSLSEGKLPADWKCANVAPIYKKGDCCDPGNYRPVSLLPVISKVLERLIYNCIIDKVRENITSAQHGFLKGRSTIGQLMTVFNEILECVDDRIQTDMIYFDLSKAFDTVPHNALIHKLRLMGFGGSLLKWLRDYLDNRYQRVVINDEPSKWLHVKSGCATRVDIRALIISDLYKRHPRCFIT